MKTTFRTICLTVTLNILHSVYATETNVCDVPELVVGSEIYNELVCLGVELMDSEDYRGAAIKFESVLQLFLNDVPNFYLFPRLAYVYNQLGDTLASEMNLEKAEISLKVYSGIYRCQEENGSFIITRSGWGRTYLIESGLNDEISGLMCGDIYDYLYHPEELSTILREAELVENYLYFKQQIE